MPDLKEMRTEIERLIQSKLNFGNHGRVKVEELSVEDNSVSFDIILHYSDDVSMFSIPNQGIAHLKGSFNLDDPDSYKGKDVCADLSPEFKEKEFCLALSELANLFTVAEV